MNLPSKVKVETVAPEHRVGEVVKVVMEAARTGEIGDGKIPMASIEEAIRDKNRWKRRKSTIDAIVYKDGFPNPRKTTW